MKIRHDRRIVKKKKGLREREESAGFEDWDQRKATKKDQDTGCNIQSVCPFSEFVGTSLGFRLLRKGSVAREGNLRKL